MLGILGQHVVTEEVHSLPNSCIFTPGVELKPIQMDTIADKFTHPGHVANAAPAAKRKNCPVREQGPAQANVEKNAVPKDKAAAHIAIAEPARDIVNAAMASTNISTNTLYYLHSYSRASDANGDENGQRTEQGFYQPRREVGTREMIQEAFAARAAEKEVLEEKIRKLKEEIAMLNAGASMKK